MAKAALVRILGLPAGTALVLANVNRQPLDLLRRSGFAAELGEEHIVPSLADAAGEAKLVPARAA